MRSHILLDRVSMLPKSSLHHESKRAVLQSLSMHSYIVSMHYTYKKDDAQFWVPIFENLIQRMSAKYLKHRIVFIWIWLMSSAAFISIYFLWDVSIGFWWTSSRTFMWISGSMGLKVVPYYTSLTKKYMRQAPYLSYGSFTSSNFCA